MAVDCDCLGTEFSRTDDIENMEKLSNLFGQVFFIFRYSPMISCLRSPIQILEPDFPEVKKPVDNSRCVFMI